MQIRGVFLIGGEDVIEEPVFEVVDDLEGKAGSGSIFVFAAEFGEPGDGIGVLQTMLFGIGVGGLGEEGFFVCEVEAGVSVEAAEGLGQGIAGGAGTDGVVEGVEDRDELFVLAVN